jgi:general secretion pathway protein D
MPTRRSRRNSEGARPGPSAAIGKSPSGRGIGFFVAAFAGLGGLALCGCTLTAISDAGTEPPDAIDRVRALDLSPRRLADTAEPAAGSSVRARVYYGSDPAGASGGAEPAPRGAGGLAAEAGPDGGPAGAADNGEQARDGVLLDFENTPIAALAKVVLGDILHVGYMIDPRVQGTVSLSSSRKIPKADLPLVLESALRSANAALVRDRTGYKIVPAEDAIGAGSTEPRGEAGEPGYGVTAIPLRHVSVTAMLKLLDGFAAKAGAVRGEPAANLLMVTGSQAERKSVLDTVRSFDADFMRGQSVGIYPVRNATPEPVIAELEKILDSGEAGLGQGLVKLQPIARMNAILVVARKPELLARAGSWIARLDGSAVAATGVKVYKVRYGEARQLARLLNEMFTGSRGGGGRDLAEGLAPGTQAGFAGAGEAAQTGGSTGFGQSGQSGFGQSSSSQAGRTGQSGLGQSGQGGFGQSGFGQGGQSGFGQGGGQAGTGQSGDEAYGALRTSGGPDGAASAAASGGTGQGGALLPGVRILPDTVNNAILVYASPSSYKLIERALSQLDRPQLQVAIEATFVEVTLNDRLSYGVQFFLGSSNLGLGTDNGSALNTASVSTVQPPSSVLPQLPGSTPGFNLVFGNALTPRAVISALHRFTDVKILSNPSLVVVNNQVATLRVGDQVSVTTGQVSPVTGGTTNVVNTFDYRDTGVILNVKPRVNANGNIFLEVEQEISNQAATVSNNGNPTFSQRRVRSSIVVANGQTVLLAGLIGDTQNRARDGIPLLDQLPLFGDAFSPSTDRRLTRTELIIFIRPQIIRDGVDAAFVAEELRAKIRGDKVGSVRPLGAIQPDPPPALLK